MRPGTHAFALHIPLPLPAAATSLVYCILCRLVCISPLLSPFVQLNELGKSLQESKFTPQTLEYLQKLKQLSNTSTAESTGVLSRALVYAKPH